MNSPYFTGGLASNCNITIRNGKRDMNMNSMLPYYRELHTQGLQSSQVKLEENRVQALLQNSPKSKSQQRDNVEPAVKADPGIYKSFHANGSKIRNTWRSGQKDSTPTLQKRKERGRKKGQRLPHICQDKQKRSGGWWAAAGSKSSV